MEWIWILFVIYNNSVWRLYSVLLYHNRDGGGVSTYNIMYVKYVRVNSEIYVYIYIYTNYDACEIGKQYSDRTRMVLSTTCALSRSHRFVLYMEWKPPHPRQTYNIIPANGSMVETQSQWRNVILHMWFFFFFFFSLLLLLS